MGPAHFQLPFVQGAAANQAQAAVQPPAAAQLRPKSTPEKGPTACQTCASRKVKCIRAEHPAKKGCDQYVHRPPIPMPAGAPTAVNANATGGT